MSSGDPAFGDEPFNSFIDRLAPAPEELAFARHAALEVAATLRAAFHPEMAEAAARTDHLVTGSIGKRTAIKPLPPVDLLYLFDGLASPKRDEIAAENFTRMEEVLHETYGGGEVISDYPRLLVRFDTVMVAVTPACEIEDGFAVPLDTGWVVTNPAAEVAALRLSDSITGGRTTRLLSLLKAWKAAELVSVPSFALEVMAREFMSEQIFRNWSDALSDFFAWARKRTPRKFDIPGVAFKLEVDDSWHPAAEAAYWRCVLARRHLSGGDVEKAAEELRHLLGAQFLAQQGFSIWDIKQDM